MAAVRKQISDGKIIIECNEEEFQAILYAVSERRYHYQGSWYTVAYNQYKKLTDDLTPPGDESQHSAKN